MRECRSRVSGFALSGSATAIRRWKNHFQASATLRAIRRGNRTSVLMHDALRDRQSQARSLGIQTAGYERLEDVGQNIGWNARPIVFDANGDPGLSISVEAPGIHHDAARRAHGIQSIAEQIDEYLNQAVRVAGYDVAVARMIRELHVRRFFVDGHQIPGVID